MAKLIISRPDGALVDYELGEETSIGRSAENDIVVVDTSVSRKQALIRAHGKDEFVLIDLGSANGTLLNGRGLSVPAVVHSGDRIQLGATTFVFVQEPVHDHGAHELRAEDTTIVRKRDRVPSLIGTSPVMTEIFDLVNKAAQTQLPVLLEGETGTGKELLARGIHRASVRADGPFVPVNCAALAETLLESQLFGHRKGAFTGAAQDQRGLFEAATGGTIFLDEVGEMPLSMQPKLLRVLQESEITPLGETRPRVVDVRVVSATNRNLAIEVEAGRFRNDLYFRLAAFPIRVPPLRERGSDIALLAERLLLAAAQRQGKRVRHLTPAALEVLKSYDWPGNVRELQNEIERAVALANFDETIDAAGFSARVLGSDDSGVTGSAGPTRPGEPEATRAQAQAQAEARKTSHESASTPEQPTPQRQEPPGPLRGARAAFEAKYIADILDQQGGNVAAAARVLGLSRVALHKKLKEYGLR